MTLYQFNKVAFLFVLLGTPAFADFQYFPQQDLDFWKVPKQQKPLHDQAEKQSLQNNEIDQNKKKFQWKTYMDPKNDEFFREGDYLPPAPFLEIIRNPTDENISNWFQYLQTKRELMLRLEKKLAEYSQNIEKLPTNSKPANPVTLDPNSKKFRIRLYFDSKCPHCEKMMATIQDLTNRGYWIEIKQIDSDLSARRNIPFAVSSATPLELKQYNIESVPTLLIGNLEEKTYSKLQGYQTTQAVLQFLTQTKTQLKKGVNSE